MLSFLGSLNAHVESEQNQSCNSHSIRRKARPLDHITATSNPLSTKTGIGFGVPLGEVSTIHLNGSIQHSLSSAVQNEEITLVDS